MLNNCIKKRCDEIRRVKIGTFSDDVSAIAAGLFDVNLFSFAHIFQFQEPPTEINRGFANIGEQKYKNELKSIFKDSLKLKAARDVLDCLPKKNQCLHVISSGKFDYWTVIKRIIELLNCPVDEIYLTTWTTKRRYSEDLVDMFDSGKIRKMTFLTGLYFKVRAPDVYSFLAEEFTRRGQKFICADNHAKIAAMFTSGGDICVEGSANFTANPRIEQFTISNDTALANFHKKWIENI